MWVRNINLLLGIQVYNIYNGNDFVKNIFVHEKPQMVIGQFLQRQEVIDFRLHSWRKDLTYSSPDIEDMFLFS